MKNWKSSRGMPKSLSVLLVISFIGKILFFVFSIESVKTGFSLPISEAWKDYAYAYIPTVQAFKEGHLPYRDFFHAYPPLFLSLLVQKRRDIIAFEVFNFALLAIPRLLTSYLLLLLLAGLLRPCMGRIDKRKKESFEFRLAMTRGDSS